MMQVDLKRVEALTDQILLAFNRGASSRELSEIYNVVIGDASDSSALRDVDAIGQVKTQRSRLKSCGVRLYNAIRRVEPCERDLFRVRMFALRCMESAISQSLISSDAVSTLVCYVRTAMMMSTLKRTGEVQDIELKHVRACFLRGFRLVSLGRALKMFQQKQQQEHKSLGDAIQDETLASTVFDGAVEFTRLEVEQLLQEVQEEQSGAKEEEVKFLASMWTDCLAVLREVRVQARFLRLARSSARKLALACYRTKDQELAVSSVGILHALYEHDLPAACNEIDDLLILAELEISTGDRALAYGTLERVQEAQRALERRQAEQDPTTSYSGDLAVQLGLLEPKKQEEEEEEEKDLEMSEEKLREVKEWVIRCRLAVAEANAKRESAPGDEVEKDQVFETFETLCRICSSSTSSIRDKEENVQASRLARSAFQCLRAVCCDICSSFGFSSRETFRQTYLQVDSCFALDARMRVELRLDVVRHLLPSDGLVFIVLEGMVAHVSELEPGEMQWLSSFLWKRLRAQVQDDDEQYTVDGVITTAQYILALVESDPVLSAYCHATLGAALAEKGNSSQAVKHALDGLGLLDDHKEKDPLLRAHLLSTCARGYFRSKQVSLGARKVVELLQIELYKDDESNVFEDILLACLEDAVQAGATREAISLLEHQQTLNPTHLVALRLANVNFSPTLVVYQSGAGVREHQLIEAGSQDEATVLATMRSIANDVNNAMDDKSQKKWPDLTLLWLQACTWTLARTSLDIVQTDSLIERGALYHSCGLVSNKLLVASQAEPEGGDDHVERAVLSFTCSIACFADVIMTRVIEIFSGCDEPGIQVALDASPERALEVDPDLVSLVSQLSASVDEQGKLQQQHDAKGNNDDVFGLGNAEIVAIGQRVAGALKKKEEQVSVDDAASASTASEQGEEEMFCVLEPINIAQLGMFYYCLRKESEAYDTFRQVLQRSLKVGFDPQLVGRSLMMLVSLSPNKDRASHWVEQAVQLQQAGQYYPSPCRTYLSRRAWNLGVEWSRCDQQDREKSLFLHAIALLKHSPASSDHEQAHELQASMRLY